MKAYLFILGIASTLIATSCKKKGCTDPNATNYSESAKKDDGSCTYATTYPVPATYVFTKNNQSTVDYSGQTARINQLIEMMTYIEGGEDAVIDAQAIKDMFANTGGNGNGHFSFTSTKQLKDKCFALDTAMLATLFDSVAAHSVHFASSATNGQAGTLTSGSSKYLFGANGVQYAEVIEKSVMGAVFMYQALNVYFGDDKMNVDNTTAVDPSNGLYYTQLEHHWDEAFGYFGVPVDFPTTPATEFWGKYCNSQNTNLSSNAVMMDNFLKGRAAITANVLSDRNTAIANIRDMWERIAANQAMTYLTNAMNYFGNDQAKYLHNLSEAYGFVYTLRFAPVATRKMTAEEVNSTLALFGNNFWNLTVQDLQTIKSTLDAKY